MNKKKEISNKEIFKAARINKVAFKYNNQKMKEDSENIIKLKETEDLNNREEKMELPKITIYDKIYFIILIVYGIIVAIHIIHYTLSEYVRKII